MIFDDLQFGLFKIQRQNYLQTIDGLIYRNKDYPILGIVKNPFNNYWLIIHIPSERSLACFSSKQDAENYLDYLAKETNINSIFLCNPHFESIEEEIKYDVEIAYLKFINGS